MFSGRCFRHLERWVARHSLSSMHTEKSELGISAIWCRTAPACGQVVRFFFKKTVSLGKENRTSRIVSRRTHPAANSVECEILPRRLLDEGVVLIVFFFDASP